MRKLFTILINLLIFFFLLGIFNNAFSIVGGDTVVNKLIIGLIFAVLMAIVPNIIKFFKVEVNTASTFLVSLLLSFIFYYLSIYILGLISVNLTTIDLGISFIHPIDLKDRTVALLFLTAVSTLFSVLMEDLRDRR